MRQKTKERRRKERELEYRISKVIALRSAKLTFNDIASQVGITRQRAHQIYFENGGLPFERETRPGQKRCTHCKQWLPVSGFHRNTKKSNGFSDRCKTCDTVLAKVYRQRHPEKIREIARRSRNNHKDRALARKRAHNAFPERQSCIVCGELGERHHEDYATPLDITWLCRKHHAQRERERRNLN